MQWELKKFEETLSIYGLEEINFLIFNIFININKKHVY
jgi:hypothetical protein